MEERKYQVSVEYPFDNADAWDFTTKEEALKEFDELKKEVDNRDVAAMLKITDLKNNYKIVEFYVNRREMFSIDELNDYESTLIAWDE